MNKADIINEVAKVVTTRKMAQDAVETVLSTITGALKENQSVTMVGFGTFKVSRRKARTGRNPQTGESLEIPARNVPTFTPGKTLKDTLK